MRRAVEPPAMSAGILATVEAGRRWPAHAAPVDSLPLTLVLLAGGLGAAAVLGLALAALVRRRSPPYLLVALAVATILARTLVAGAAIEGLLPAEDHHLAEHALDVAMVALVIAAVYAARTPPADAHEDG